MALFLGRSIDEDVIITYSYKLLIKQEKNILDVFLLPHEFQKINKKIHIAVKIVIETAELHKTD